MDLLLPFALKSLLMAGAALILLRLFRKRSAAARGFIAHLALLAVVLGPMASLILPRLPLSVPGLPMGGGMTRAVSAALGMAHFAQPTAVQTVATGQMAGENPDWAVLAYALPTIILLVITLVALGRLFALRTRADVLVETRWLNVLAQAQRRMGFKHGTALLVSNDLSSPINWGLMRPVILLNRDALCAHDQAEAIIAHELAHIARFDWTKLLLARIATAIHWFNPLVWLLAREAHQLREEAADDAVLAANIVDTEYAQLLIGTARPQHKGLMLTAHGVAADRHSLTRRIRRILDTGSARGPAARSFAASIGAGIFVFATPLAAISFDGKATPMETAHYRTLPAAAVNSARLLCPTAPAPTPLRSPQGMSFRGGHISPDRVPSNSLSI